MIPHPLIEGCWVHRQNTHRDRGLQAYRSSTVRESMRRSRSGWSPSASRTTTIRMSDFQRSEPKHRLVLIVSVAGNQPHSESPIVSSGPTRHLESKWPGPAGCYQVTGPVVLKDEERNPVSRWLVTYVPSWILLIGLIVVIAGGAVLIQRYVRHRNPTLPGGEHNDVTKFTYGFIGFVYAFFVGFVVSSMWGQINTADGNAHVESAEAIQMAKDSVVFDAADTDRIRHALLAYTQAAVTEWTQAGEGHSTEADRALASLYTAYEQVQAKTDIQKSVLSTSLSNLDKTSQARTARLLTARDDTGPPWPLWAVIFLNSGLVLGTVIIYGVEKPALHYSMVAVVGVIVATNLFLILELAHPFVGLISTSSESLQEAVSVLSQPAT